ncbi:MAG: antitoxin MazE family protein [Nocardioidaceae bacterium]
MAEHDPSPIRQRVAAHRARLRRQGLRPVQIWVPDVRAPGFAAEAHRQSALAAASPHEVEDQAFVDAISWFGDEADDEDEE